MRMNRDMRWFARVDSKIMAMTLKVIYKTIFCMRQRSHIDVNVKTNERRTSNCLKGKV